MRDSEMSEGALKFDAGKARWDLLPFAALDQVAKVMTFGASKYADRNWEKGLAWGRLLGAAMRHLSAWSRGISIDPESNLPHLAHAAACVLMLLGLTLGASEEVGSDPNDDRSKL